MISTRHPLIAWILILAVIFGMSPVKAQSTHELAVNYYSNLLEYQIPRILDRIRPNMTSAERRIASEVRFRVIRDGLTNGVAFKEGGRRVIEIHAGLARAAEIMSEMRAYTLLNQDEGAAGAAYLRYVADGIYEAFAGKNRTRSVTEIQSFAVYIGAGQAEWERFRSERVVQEAIELEMNSSLMFLIGHELGHHFKDHRRQSDLNRRRVQEEEADEIGRRLMRGTGYYPIFAMPLMLVFAVWEPEAHRREWARTHPAPLTRMENNLRASADALRSDPVSCAICAKPAVRKSSTVRSKRTCNPLDNCAFPSELR